MQMTVRLSLLLMLLSAGGCTGMGGGASMDEYDPDEFPILWQRAGTYSSLDVPLRLVVRNRAEMALCPVSNVPVDFEKDMVLVAGMGRVYSDQYCIRINRIWREGSRLKVDVQVYRTESGSESVIKLASPYHVVVIPRSDLNVEGFAPDLRHATPKRARGLPLGP